MLGGPLYDRFPLSLSINAVAIAVTPQGIGTVAPFCAATQTPLLVPERLRPEVECPAAIGLQSKCYGGSLPGALAAYWNSHDALIFALATGAVVRLIAPLLKDKATDPAVVVVDEAGQFVISLCGGHQGGSDRLAQAVSHHLDATPVITGAAHHRQLPGIDVLGRPFGWHRGSGNWTGVASALAQGEPVQVIQEAGTDLWQTHLPAGHSFQFGWPEVAAKQPLQPPAPKGRLWISPTQRRFSDEADIPKAQWHPRVLWLGIGCERGTPQALMEWAIAQVLQSQHLAMGAVAGVATLDLKGDEAGLVALCREHQWPLRCFSAEALSQVAVPTPSAVVEAAVGTASVAEAAAMLAAARGPFPLEHPALMALTPPPESPDLAGSGQPEPRKPLCVPKQIVRHPDYPGALTLAIAQSDQEFTGRSGSLALVGIGPGRLDQITAAAKAALSQADAVIGYNLYIDQVRPLLQPGQIVESFPITQEQQRANRAIALAGWGLSVAVISSGDCGIYAMAGLVLETLQSQGWDGQTPRVESFPGISALQAAAARVGAPLMHDFCAISLSDLLTPWPVIERRLAAAAAADFVVALYNPKSQKRTGQIAQAQGILARHRSPTTPVAIVQSAYRPTEQIAVTTLEDMLNQPIDMLTTVIIGNRSTRLYAGKLITPRGYTV